MTTITTNTAAATTKTAPILASLVARLVALKPAPKSPEALLAAQSRREAARAAADRLLR